MINEKLVKEITGEEQIDKIYKLDLSSKNIERINNLKRYEKLRCLILNFNYISVIQNIQSLADLRQLHLQNNNIQKISGLQVNKYLTHLNLSNNLIQKIQNISHLTRLETLNLNSNKITKLNCLEFLKELKNLSVSNNRITSIESMPTFSKLQMLDLSNNSIQKISNNSFTSSNKLINLNLSFNSLGDTRFLNQLTSLQSLNLSHNNFTKFEIQSINDNLQNLDLSYNNIVQLPYFAAILSGLVSLNIRQNCILSEMQLLQSIANCQSLVNIDFRQNPIYSQQFSNTINQIHKLDEINGKKIQKAGTKYYKQIQQIQKQFITNPLMYLNDDQEDRKIKFSGFQSEKLQEEMTGMKPNRPVSPTHKKIKNKANVLMLDDLQKNYKEFQQNNSKINELRSKYLFIFQNNNIKPIIQQNNTFQQSFPSQKKPQITQQEMTKFNNIDEIKKENQQTMNKWKQLKNKQKNFNIRDLVRKSSGKEKTISKNKTQNDFLKTQIPQKWNVELKSLKTVRPGSLKKKQNSSNH